MSTLRILMAVGLCSLVACSRDTAPRPEPSPRTAPLPIATPVAEPAAAPSAGMPTNATSLAILKEALHAPGFEARLMALEVVADRRIVGLVPDVGYALGDPDHDVRLSAVRALSRLPSAQSERLLRSVRDDAKEALDIRALAAGALFNP